MEGWPKKSFFHFSRYISYYDINIWARYSTNLAQFSKHLINSKNGRLTSYRLIIILRSDNNKSIRNLNNKSKSDKGYILHNIYIIKNIFLIFIFIYLKKNNLKENIFSLFKKTLLWPEKNNWHKKKYWKNTWCGYFRWACNKLITKSKKK